jgi:hypothetical protein
MWNVDSIATDHVLTHINRKLLDTFRIISACIEPSDRSPAELMQERLCSVPGRSDRPQLPLFSILSTSRHDVRMMKQRNEKSRKFASPYWHAHPRSVASAVLSDIPKRPATFSIGGDCSVSELGHISNTIKK